MTVEIPPEFQQFVHQVIDSGSYQSEEAVVGEALRLLQHRQQRLEELRREIQPALDGLDRWPERVRVMQDSPERTALYATMIRMISEECPVMLKYEPEDFVLYHDWDGHMKQHPIGYGFFKYHRIDTAMRAAEGGGL